MAIIPLEFVQGMFQGFGDISELGDALYFKYRNRAAFIIFDNSLIDYPAAQFVLRFYLLGQANRNGSRRCSANLNDFGLCLEDDNLDLMMFSLSVLGENVFNQQKNGTG